ncbi:hypothetical protein LCL96_02075 [Rossellomorea aquimaris]|uniref:hypothetical protein n=1 Tax=Rossellomorea aquimaris TaxID=189382 RepID=UPI001CD4D717|nr:hypothetical protein [Rossellomorea aquimaris]MCA1057699.1 hypothetical protein [Rossellomorea aquimaris]
MNHFVLLCILFVIAVTVELIGLTIFKRYKKGKTLLFSSVVWGSLMVVFSVVWFLGN